MYCLENDPQWYPGFLELLRRSWLCLVQLRIVSELVSSAEIHQVYTKHPKCVMPSS